MISLSTITDDPERLAKLMRALEDTGPLKDEIGQMLVGWVRLDFQKLYAGKAGYGGKPWAPLAPSTVQKKGGPVPIGYETGKMSSAINYSVYGDDIAVGYTGPQYTIYFDGGTRRMPARPLIPDPIPQRWVRDIEQAVNDWIDELEG